VTARRTGCSGSWVRRFATKIALARRMLARALDAGVPAAWCTADESYGGDRGLRRDLQGGGIGYLLALARSHAPQPVDGELASRCWSPQPIGLPALVRVAGVRWSIECCFQTGENAVGLDQHQVHRWD
jgi:SRSO17 transposase